MTGSVIDGKNSYLFLGNDNNRIIDQTVGKCALSRLFLQKWFSFHYDVKISVEQRGAKYFYIIAPNKETSLREFLPDDIVYQQNGPTPTNQLLAAHEHHKDFLYYDPDLLERIGSPFATYDKNSSIWTSQGAMKYVLAALDSLGATDLRNKLLAVPLALGNNKSPGDLGAIVGRTPEAIETFKLLTPYSQIVYESALAGVGYIRHTFSKNGSGRAIFFHDSFIAPIIPTLSELFEQALFIQTNDYMSELVMAFEPQYVFRLQAERLCLRLSVHIDNALQWFKDLEADRAATDASSAYVEKLLAKAPIAVPRRPVRKKVMFCHIPKNAGTSIAAHLVGQFSWPEIFGLDGQKLLLKHLIEHQKGVVQTHSFVSGHIPLSCIEDVLDQFDLIIAIVRPPLERLISHYQYFIQEGHVRDEISLEEFLDTSYVANPSTRNAQCGYLGKDNRFLSVKERLASTPSLRLVPYHALDRLDAVAEEFDLKPFHLSRLNVSRVKVDPWASLTPALYNKVFDWFSEDFLMYDYIMGKKN
ncbi:MAG TPA: sulfotransferase family 2 domain-containing protein [Stellaceae bacterium]|jgi:hypothetical protein|nr:sulfotransferase family 2 domain-containing protein [Stellaceae bacterium]